MMIVYTIINYLKISFKSFLDKTQAEIDNDKIFCINMNHKNIPFVIYTHSSYFDVLRVFLSQHKKFAKDIENVVIFADQQYQNLPNQIIYDGAKTYPQRLLECFEKLEVKTCFFLHEDMFLYGNPNFSQIDLCIDKVCKDEFDFIKLIGGTDMEYSRISENLYKIGMNSLWIFSIQPTIWNVEKFCQILSHHGDKNIWELETAAQKTCVELKINSGACFQNGIKRGLHHYDNAIYPYIATEICKGKWDTIEYPNLTDILFSHLIESKIRGIFPFQR